MSKPIETRGQQEFWQIGAAIYMRAVGPCADISSEGFPFDLDVLCGEQKWNYPRVLIARTSKGRPWKKITDVAPVKETLQKPEKETPLRKEVSDLEWVQIQVAQHLKSVGIKRAK